MKLKEALKFVPKLDSTVPIANNILLSDGKLKWTNFRTSGIIYLDDIPTHISCLIDPRIFRHTIEHITGYDIHVENGTMVIVSKNGEYKLPVLSIDEFPEINKFEDLSNITLSGIAVSAIVEAAQFTSRDDTALEFVNVKFGEEYVVTSSNRYILYQSKLPFPSEEVFEINLSKDFINNIPKNMVSCSINIKDNIAEFNFGDIVLQTLLGNVNYPDVSFINKYDKKFDVELTASYLNKIISPLGAYINSATNIIVLNFSNELIVSAEDKNMAVSGVVNTKIQCNAGGEHIIKLNYYFLSKILSTFDEVVRIDYEANDKPLRFVGRDKIITLMPMM